MADVSAFVRAVQENYGMRPVVPLEHPIAIGDIGRIGADGAWEPISTTRHRFNALPSKVRNTKDGRGIWDASSGKDVSFKAYARGQTSQLVRNVADAKARAEIEFGSSKSFVFAAKGVTIRSATEVGELIEKIRRAYHLRRRLPEGERWTKDLAFVFAVGDAQRLTAMLATRANTTVSVTGRGSVGPPSAPADLAAGVNLGIASNELIRFNQADAAGRLYRAYRLKPSLLTTWENEDWGELRAIRRIDEFAADEPREAAPAPLTLDEAFDEVSR
jgi:hypothetical protein